MTEILNHIPIGRKNAISRRQLSISTGLSDRVLREQISQLRRDYVILNTQDGKGYYRPSPEDKAQVERWTAQETRRAKSIFWSMRGAKIYLKGEGNAKTN